MFAEPVLLCDQGEVKALEGDTENGFVRSVSSTLARRAWGRASTERMLDGHTCSGLISSLGMYFWTLELWRGSDLEPEKREGSRRSLEFSYLWGVAVRAPFKQEWACRLMRGSLICHTPATSSAAYAVGAAVSIPAPLMSLPVDEHWFRRVVTGSGMRRRRSYPPWPAHAESGPLPSSGPWMRDVFGASIVYAGRAESARDKVITCNVDPPGVKRNEWRQHI